MTPSVIYRALHPGAVPAKPDYRLPVSHGMGIAASLRELIEIYSCRMFVAGWSDQLLMRTSAQVLS